MEPMRGSAILARPIVKQKNGVWWQQPKSSICKHSVYSVSIKSLYLWSAFICNLFSINIFFFDFIKIFSWAVANIVWDISGVSETAFDKKCVNPLDVIGPSLPKMLYHWWDPTLFMWKREMSFWENVVLKWIKFIKYLYVYPLYITKDSMHF